MTELATVEGVELAAVGNWDCTTGEWNCTEQNIADAVAASAEPDWRAPIIKLGHTDERFNPPDRDGQPAIGTIRNIRASLDGKRLIGDFVGVPAWLAKILPSAYPSRSIEGEKHIKSAAGNAYSFRLTALSLLGEEPPAIESLADIQRMYDLAASAQPDAAERIVTRPISSAPIAAAAAPTHPKGAGMTPEQIREAIGLTPTASEIEVQAKLAALGLIPKAVEPVVEPIVEPVAPVAVVEPKAPEVAELPDISEHPIVAELRESLRQLTEEREAEKVAAAAKERDDFLAMAVRTGRIKPADKERIGKNYDEAPDVTKEFVMARKGNSEIPVAAVGHADNPEGTIDDEFEALIPDPGEGF